ncbi:MAG: hypothetical protein KDA91_18190 [Planctomycetaceae bacterium]|nr:hypothetical protein [Planctomycetaceae bacterium]
MFSAFIRSRWGVISFAIFLGLWIPVAHRRTVYECGLSLWILFAPGFITYVAIARPVLSVLAALVLVVVFSLRLYTLDVPWFYAGPPFAPDTVFINIAVATACFCISVIASTVYLLRPSLLRTWQPEINSATK